MRSDRSLTERILGVLRPYASNWSGTLGRGDLVIPQRDIPRVVHEVLDAMHEENEWDEVGERELVESLLAIRRSESVQDQVQALRRQFTIPSAPPDGAARSRSFVEPDARHSLRGATAIAGSASRRRGSTGRARSASPSKPCRPRSTTRASPAGTSTGSS
jgi:hypothetical protein